MPVDSSVRRNSPTMRSRSAGVASIGTRSLSWKLTPQAPRSASRRTASHGSSAGRTNSPNGSRPRLPTVQRPKVNLSAGVGCSDMVSDTGSEARVDGHVVLQRVRGRAALVGDRPLRERLEIEDAGVPPPGRLLFLNCE